MAVAGTGASPVGEPQVGIGYWAGRLRVAAAVRDGFEVSGRTTAPDEDDWTPGGPELGEGGQGGVPVEGVPGEVPGV